MLLEPLVSTIETLKQRIAIHGPALRQNETRTRAALIDPLLQALGWDVSDPSLVTPEYRVDVGWADYALLGVGNKPAAVIEAKRLGSIVENHLDQAVGYCIQQGIAYVGVTDGSHWQLYRTFEPVPLVEKLVLDVSIADTPAHEAALKLLLIWRTNLAFGQPVMANAPVLIEPTEHPSRPVSQTANSMTASVNTATADLASGDWIPLVRIDNVTGMKAPVAIKFGDGETRSLRAWWQLLTESAEFLGRNGLLTVEHCPIDAGRGWRFINSGPHSPNGRNFITPKQVSNGIYMETHLSAKAVVSYSKRLLAHFGTNLEGVGLRFG